MESSEWPNAMTTAMAPICGQMVPLNQPSDSAVNWRLRGIGAGGSLTLGASSRVMGHQIRKATTITVVICMMRRNAFAAVFGMVVTIYFWWSNIKGIHESSGKALRIMQIT